MTHYNLIAWSIAAFICISCAATAAVIEGQVYQLEKEIKSMQKHITDEHNQLQQLQWTWNTLNAAPHLEKLNQRYLNLKKPTLQHIHTTLEDIHE